MLPASERVELTKVRILGKLFVCATISMLSVEKVPSNTVLYRTVWINKENENNEIVSISYCKLFYTNCQMKATPVATFFVKFTNHSRKSWCHFLLGLINM